MIDEMQQEAAELFSAGEYRHALAEFSVLREIRSRREGPYSTMYLSNLHDCVRCMSHLQLWADSTPLCGELHSKYVRTHGRGQDDTVDVAKHWAWALIHLHEYPPAVRLYLTTADALWDTDPAAAQQLLAAAVAHRDSTGAAGVLGQDTVSLHHRGELTTSVEQLIRQVAGDEKRARAATTLDGLALA